MGDIVVLGLALDYQKFDAAERQVEGSLTRLEKKFDATTAANNKLQQGINSGTARNLQPLASQISGISSQSQAAGAALGTLRTQLAGAGAGATQAAGALGAMTGPLGIAISLAVVGAGAYLALGKAFFDASVEGSKIAREFLDISQKTGVATDKLLLYKIAAERSGSSLKDFAGAIKTSNEKIEEAALGNEKLSAIYKALGVDARKAATEPAQAFEQLASTVAKITDPLLRAKVANELFGSSGEDLISTFKTLDEDGETLRKRMAALGITLSQDAAKSAGAISSELVILGAVMDDLKLKIAAGAAPKIIGALELIEGAIVKIEPVIFAFAGKFIDDFTLLAALVDKVASGFDSLYRAAGGAQNSPRPGAYAPGSYAGKLADASRETEARNRARGFQIDPQTGLPTAAPDPYAALRNALRAGGSHNAAGEEKARRDAALALERALGEQRVAIAKGVEARQTQLLEAQLQDRLISIEEFYKQREQVAERALNAEIQAERDKIKASEEQIARLQRGGVTKREETEILQTKAKIAGAETKIIELRDRASAQAQRNAREQALALRQLETAAAEVQGQLYELTGNEAQAIIEANDRRFRDLIQQFRANGREEAAKAAEEVQAILNTRATAAGYGRGVDQRQKQLALDSLSIQNDVRLGLIGEGEARERILKLERDAVGALRDKLETQLLLSESAKDPQAVARIKEQIELLRQLGRDELDLLRQRASAGFLNDPAFRDTAQLEAEKSRLSGMQSLAAEIVALEDRIAHAGEDSALRIQKAHLEAIAEILDADTRAAEERVRNQVRLAEVVSGRVNPERLNDGLLKVLASQKSLQESLEDFRANTAQDAFRGIDTVIDRFAEKLGVAGSAVAQLAKDLARLALTKGLDKLLGLSSATGGVKGAIADALGVKRNAGASVADVVGEGALKEKLDPNTLRLVEITMGIDRKFERALDFLRQIEANTENSASCCRSAEDRAAQGSQGGSFWGSVLGTFLGAFTGGLIGGGGGGDGGGSGELTGVTFGEEVPVVPIAPRATGGPVMSGQPYLVGDGGEPELFIPHTNGYITPMSKARTAAGSTINVTINVTGVKDPNDFDRSKAQIARQVVEAIADAQRFQ